MPNSAFFQQIFSVSQKFHFSQTVVHTLSSSSLRHPTYDTFILHSNQVTIPARGQHISALTTMMASGTQEPGSQPALELVEFNRVRHHRAVAPSRFMLSYVFISSLGPFFLSCKPDHTQLFSNSYFRGHEKKVKVSPSRFGEFAQIWTC